LTGKEGGGRLAEARKQRVSAPSSTNFRSLPLPLFGVAPYMTTTPLHAANPSSFGLVGVASGRGRGRGRTT
jgi:hypothetical protein